jgi:hypothetical protein
LFGLSDPLPAVLINHQFPTQIFSPVCPPSFTGKLCYKVVITTLSISPTITITSGFSKDSSDTQMKETYHFQILTDIRSWWFMFHL